MPRQRGTSLLVVLVALSMLIIGGLALYQSAQTTMLASGAIAQQQAATAAADVGVNAATRYLVALGTPDTSDPNRYFAVQQPEDGNGLPAIGWGPVPTQATGAFAVQYVLERLCDPPLPVADPAAQCSIGPNLDATASHRVGSAAYATAGKRYYRATVRVTGARNLELFTQAVLSH